MSERQLATKQPSARPKRQTTGSRNRLSIAGQDPNFVYRVAAVDNEARIGRVEELKGMGWEVVPGVDVGDARVDIGKGIGKTGVISLGGATTGVPMRIPRDWYNEYQREKQADIDARAEEINQKLTPEKGS